MSAGIEKCKLIEETHKSLAQNIKRPEVVHTSTNVSCGLALSLITIEVSGIRKTFEGFDYRGDWRESFRVAFIRALYFVHYTAVSE